MIAGLEADEEVVPFAEKRGWYSTSPFSRARPGDADVRLVLRRGAWIGGHVEAPDGVEVKEYRASLLGPRWSSSAPDRDAERFTFDAVPPGAYKLLVCAGEAGAAGEDLVLPAHGMRNGVPATPGDRESGAAARRKAAVVAGTAGRNLKLFMVPSDISFGIRRGRDGRGTAADSPHFLNAGTSPVAFDVPPGSVAGFEARPFVDREVFYFDDVLLPAAGTSFSAPPAVEVPVDGEEIDASPAGLDPISLRVRVRGGIRVTGITGKTNRGILLIAPLEPGEAGRKTEVIHEITGISPREVSVEVLDRDGKKISGSSSTAASSPGKYSVGQRSVDAPFERIGALRLTIR